MPNIGPCGRPGQVFKQEGVTNTKAESIYNKKDNLL